MIKSVTKTSLLRAATAMAFLAVPASLSAQVVTLDFEGINSSYPSGFAQVLDFYNGGTSSDGTTGTNYGISFGSNALAICLNTIGVTCSNTSRGGLGDPTSQRGGLFFLDGGETFLNFSAGFETGFSFNYVGQFTGSVGVYDGLNGTGNLLGSVSLVPNGGNCPAYDSNGFCPFGPAGVTFAGIGRSISFGGVANQIVFDDVTFGSAVPGGGGGVPEPATWAMLILGMGAVGGAMRRRQSARIAFA